MQKALRLLATATISGIVAFAAAISPGCSNGPTGSDGGTDSGTTTGSVCAGKTFETCSCTTKADCKATTDAAGKNFICTPAHACVPICASNADCGTGQICEDAICRPPGCGADADCQSGQQCIGGTCTSRVTPDKVASCAVEPATAVLHSGSTKSFSVLAKDSSGNVIPFKANSGEVTWGADAAVGTTSDTGASATVTGAMASGAGNVTAKIGSGSITCTPSAVTNFGPVANGSFRVVVVSAADQSFVSGATVLVDGAPATANGNEYDAEVTPAANGSTVSVFKNGYSYVTYLGTKSNDLVVYVKPQVMPGKAKGTMDSTSFNGVSDIRGTVHLAINGPSIAGNLIDISLTTLLGQSVPTHIDLGGSTQTDVNLPDGIAIGLGSQMFKSSYSVQSDPGLRDVWSLGGNVVLSDVLGVVSSATGGGSIDVGSILSALLPVVGRLESGVLVGKQFTSGDAGTLDLKLDTLLRLQTVAKIPQFKSYTLGGQQQMFDGAVVIGGALQSPEGLVPLGLTAGVDKHTGSSTTDMTPDGIIDPVGMGGQPGDLPLRLAPLHGGLEGSKYTTLAIGANLSSLLGGVTGGSTGMKTPLILSGRVVFPGDILFKNNGQAANTIAVPDFMTPADISVNEHARSVSVASVSGADLYRLDLTASDGGEWQVYFPPTLADGLTPIAIPDAPEGATDRFAPDANGAFPTTTLQAVSLKGKSGVDYNSVLTFDGDNTDDLTSSIDAFTAHGVIRTAPPAPN